MINERTFNSIFREKKQHPTVNKIRALNHYQEQVRQLDIMQEELLINAFRSTGQSASGLNVKPFVEDQEVESGYNITENAIEAFKTYLAAETLRTEDQEK